MTFIQSIYKNQNYKNKRRNRNHNNQQNRTNQNQKFKLPKNNIHNDIKEEIKG